MKEINELFFENQDLGYKDFISKLTPNIPKDCFIGVRNPKMREIAKRIFKGDLKDKINYQKFFEEVPHYYYEENMLHSLLLEQIKDYDTFVREMDRFVSYIDNWAVCDTMKPKVIEKHKENYLKKVQEYIHSEQPYVIRFGVGVLMGYFLDDEFKEEYLEWVSVIKSEEYYVNMMVAWFFATALAKQYEATIPYLVNNRLDVWTHNKTISKCVDSFRISEEQKDYLKSLRIRK